MDSSSLLEPDSLDSTCSPDEFNLRLQILTQNERLHGSDSDALQFSTHDSQNVEDLRLGGMVGTKEYQKLSAEVDPISRGPKPVVPKTKDDLTRF